MRQSNYLTKGLLVKPKEALLKGGIITEIKRGRLSLDQIEWCKTKAAEGWAIDGYSLSVGTAVAPATVTRVPVTNEKVIADGFIRYVESEWQARETDTGKVRNMREACGNCKLSLTGHMCEHPRIVANDGRLGHVPVTIERKV